MRFRSAGLLVCGLLGLLTPGELRALIDPFYLDAEREAQGAASRGDAVAAAKLYRVACFGMLDEPSRLAACTVRLAKAQAAVKDVEGFRASYLRLALVEERFQGLTRSGVSLDEKRELALLAETRMTSEAFGRIPELSALAAAAREVEPAPAKPKATKPKPKSRRSQPVEPEIPEAAPPEMASGVSPEEGQIVQQEGDSPRESAPAGESATEAASLIQPTTQPLVDSAEDRERLDAARRRIAERPERSVVEAELDAVRAISDRYPGDVEAARQTGDLAYLLGLWPVCADYYQRAGDPGAERPLERFYMAVCLFETGQTESAARILAPSADRLKHSPFVDGYLSRILGSPASP